MDILDKLAEQARETIKTGYYELEIGTEGGRSLKKTLKKRKFSLIGELKYASPAHGQIRKETDPVATARIMARYCAGLSILTEPKSFSGSLKRFCAVRKIVDLPLLMKDFVIDPVQIDAAKRIGADLVLLIYTLSDRGYFSLSEMIAYAHERGIEVLLEVHSQKELKSAVKTEADILGINNRDLRSMKTDVSYTLELIGDLQTDKPIISESGFDNRSQVLKVKGRVDAVLVGRSLMASEDIEEKLAELMGCG
ncbi:MAG: indole-3-glycerol-phosphate synthase [Euryarchaeota archaeon]|nr:indole-3-glycerol-phosphate synthase [Euryarchaeota archaeon]